MKEAARDTDTAFSDALCDRLCKKDTVGFWKSWRKHFCMKNLKPIQVCLMANMVTMLCECDKNLQIILREYLHPIIIIIIEIVHGVHI